jgi:hypothetical protein
MVSITNIQLVNMKMEISNKDIYRQMGHFPFDVRRW